MGEGEDGVQNSTLGEPGLHIFSVYIPQSLQILCIQLHSYDVSWWPSLVAGNLIKYRGKHSISNFAPKPGTLGAEQKRLYLSTGVGVVEAPESERRLREWPGAANWLHFKVLQTFSSLTRPPQVAPPPIPARQHLTGVCKGNSFSLSSSGPSGANVICIEYHPSSPCPFSQPHTCLHLSTHTHVLQMKMSSDEAHSIYLCKLKEDKRWGQTAKQFWWQLLYKVYFCTNLQERQGNKTEWIVKEWKENKKCCKRKTSNVSISLKTMDPNQTLGKKV